MKYLKKWIKRIGIMLLSVGWLVPLYYSLGSRIYFFSRFFLKDHVQLNRKYRTWIEWGTLSDYFLNITLVWLLLALIVWSILGLKISKKKENPRMNRFFYFARILGLVLFSVGWMVPFYLSIHYVNRFILMDVFPHLIGESHTLISRFPYTQASNLMLNISLIWLALVVIFWVICGILAFDRIKKNQS